MSGYTPGPWSWEYDNADCGRAQWYEVRGPQNKQLLDFGWNDEGLEQKANARLIAAAPELLEACKRALSMLDQMPNHVFNITEMMLKEAIAKATGDKA